VSISSETTPSWEANIDETQLGTNILERVRI